MKQAVVVLLLLAGCAAPEAERPAPAEAADAPVVLEAYQPQPGLLRIGPEPERAIPLVEKGYTLILPARREAPAGVVLFLDGWKTDVPEGGPPPGTFEHEALARNLAILRLTTGNPLDFFFEEETLVDVAERVQTLLDANGLRQTPLYLAGLSLGGTRALKLAVFLKQQRDRFWIAPRAAAIVDAPLDMVRLWEAEQRAARDAFHPAAADEGRWVAYLLETHLGGTPRAQFDRYVAYSPFVHAAPQGGNAVYLADLPLRAYHEPDVDWWIAHRRKSYYQMNSIDLAALVNALKLQGNEQAALLTTHRARDGVEEGASPHTWSIVDNADLVAWLLDQQDG